MDEAYISYNDAQPKGSKLQTDMTVSETFGGKLEMSFEVKRKIKYNMEYKAEIQLEAGLKGDCNFKITVSPNAKIDNIIDWTTKFSGLIVTGYFKITTSSRNDNKKPTDMDPITLIPSLPVTPFSMIIGEGKANKY